MRDIVCDIERLDNGQRSAIGRKIYLALENGSKTRYNYLRQGKRADNGLSSRVLNCIQAGLLQRSTAAHLHLPFKRTSGWKGNLFDRLTHCLPFWELVPRLSHDF